MSTVGKTTRLAFIVGFVLVSALLVTVIGESLRTEEDRSAVLIEAEATAVRSESGVFRTQGVGGAREPVRDGARQRTMDTFLERRAYPGAPPVIPHPVQNDGFMADGCLDCHRGGGWVPEQQAYAPVTPHPDYGNCRQCHVPMDEDTPLFADIDWHPRLAPEMDVRAMPGAPPVIPHDLQLREDCHACHTGPAAVAEIRTDHGDRVHCRQCHVPADEQGGVFTRALGGRDAN